MDKERFSLLLLEPNEIYFEDFSVDLLPVKSTKAKNDESELDEDELILGRLKVCSKSLVFESKNIRLPLLKFNYSDCDEIIGSTNRENNCLILSCAQHVEMLTNNIIAPYKFIRHKQTFVFNFHYIKVHDRVLQFCQQLHRASSLHASDQNDMIATMVYSLHNRSKFDPLWFDSIYEKILFDCKANEIHPLVLNPGRLLLTDACIYFQPYNNIQPNPVIKIKHKDVTGFIKRRFVLKHTGLEVKWSENRHIYVSFQNEIELDRFLNTAAEQPNIKLPQIETESMTLKWQNGVISNYEYLLYLNSLADRSFDDLTQYPIFPWILTDYISEEIDLKDEKNYRDLSKPMGALNKERLDRLKERSEEMGDPKYLYGSHYSTPGFVLFYLVRKYPHLMLCLQNGRFDHPDRMFNSVSDTFKNCLLNMSDFKELTPEFYDTSQNGDFLMNINKINFGSRFDGSAVNNVALPRWAKNSPRMFVHILREALESDFVSYNLHYWIDLIFGYKQRGTEAEKANNVFYHLCYEGAVDLNSVKDPTERHALEVQISEFGQVPKQLFDKPHVARNSTQLEEIENGFILVDSLPLSPKFKFELNFDTAYSAHKDSITSLFLEDDNIISTGKDGVLKCYSLVQRRQIRNISISDLPLSSCIKLPNSNVYALGAWDNNILLYNCNYGRMSDVIPAHEDSVTCLSLDEELGILISGSWDCSVKIWRGFDNIEKKTFRLSTSMVACCPLDDKIACITNRRLRDRLQIVIGTDIGDIYIWDIPLISIHSAVNSEIPEPRPFLQHPKSVTCLQFNSTATKLASCSEDGLLQVTDIITGMNLFLKKLPATPSSLCWHSKFDYLFTVDVDGEMFVWDLVTVQLKTHITVSKGPLTYVKCNQSGDMIITAGRDEFDYKITCWKFT